ncbi:MAG: RNA 2',3'-cyclic phosphodiesterase [Patescibacteria group bacterium]
MRCFIAIEIPEDIKSKIEEFLTPLRSVNSNNKIKWVDSRNIHLTWQFIGELDFNSVAELKKSLAQIKFAPFEIGFDNKLSFFPNQFRPNVIKLDVVDQRGELKRINSLIREQLDKIKIEYDRKPFLAHITLGRIKYFSGDFKRLILPSFLSFTVDRFDLYCSDLTADGPIHTKLT